MAQAIGGQAVLEGVMMRGPRNWAVAVRKPDGEIAQVARQIDPAGRAPLGAPPADRPRASSRSASRSRSASARSSVSANYAAVVDTEEERPRGEEPDEIGRWTLFFSFAVAIGFALMLFKVGPALLADLLPISNGGWFVLVEGLIRVSVFVVLPRAAQPASRRSSASSSTTPPSTR